jgi:UDP-3-O-[3-hydroxymyristoyl] glucosamine N-acyltransferase
MRKLNLTIQEICKVVEGTCSLDPSFLVRHIASLEHAQVSDLAVVFDPDENTVFGQLSLDKVRASKAAVLLASTEVVPGKNYIIVKNPLVALEKLAYYLDTKNDKGPLIHPTVCMSEFAVIEDNVKIGPYTVVADDVKIGYGAQIGAHVVLGKGCQVGCYSIIHPGVKILDRCIVGDYTIIHAGVVIGSDGFGYRITKQGMLKIPHLGIVRIGNHVELGANTCIDRAEFEETVIGDGVKIDNEVHIAHNVKVGAHTAILAQTGIAGSTVIGMGCQIGGQVAIKDHVVIGNGVKIVSKTAVMKDLNDGEVVCGIPSMPFLQWKRMVVVMTKLPEMMKAFEEFRKPRGFFKRLFGK